MVRTVSEVEHFIRHVDNRCNTGILIETKESVQIVEDLACLPLHATYIGLNDLSISMKTNHIFAAILDGTVESVAEVLNRRQRPFGWAGATMIDAGNPIPCWLLLTELSRLGTSFTFLRRSFRRDSIGRDLVLEVGLIRKLWHRLRNRSAAETAEHQRLLYRKIESLAF
jgi:hypothetical protein